MSDYSDDDDGYEYSDLEYSSDENGNEEDSELVLIENTFYDADDYEKTNPDKSIEMYERVVELERERGGEVKYAFKALLKLVKLHYGKGSFDVMVRHYERLLAYIEQVTSNELQDAIQSVLDTVSASTEVGMLSRVYEVTLQALKASHNERLWLSTMCDKGRIYVIAKDWDSLEPLIAELHQACRNPDGTDDKSKGNHLMDVYSLEIQLATARKDRTRMKDIYDRVMVLNAAVSDPRVQGIVHHSFGVMRMSERKWEAAYDEFYAAFKNYQESGHSEARTSLKYLVLANILSSSTIDPFDSPEALVYKEDREVKAMSELRNAYRHNDVTAFERVLKDRRNKIATDDVIAPVVSDLLRNVRSRVILRVVRPYSAVRLAFLASQLSVSLDDVEALLVDLILDGQLDGQIDQTEGVLRLKMSAGSETKGLAPKALTAIESWTEELSKLHNSIGRSLLSAL